MKTDLQNFLIMLANGKTDYKKANHYPPQGGNFKTCVTISKLNKETIFEFNHLGEFKEVY